MPNPQPKICIPVQLKTTQAVIDFIQKNQAQADLFEIWLDGIENLNLNKIFEHKIKPILCVCKNSQEKRNFAGNDAEKVQILKKALELGADYVDLDYQTAPELIEDLSQNKHKGKLILSYHNFELTPDLKNLLAVVQTMLKFNPDIIKIATMANAYRDAIIILNLAQALAVAKIPFIAIAMGQSGKITRILTPLLGAEMMFAPLDAKSGTASGQIPMAELKKYWKEFAI